MLRRLHNRAKISESPSDGRWSKSIVWIDADHTHVSDDEQGAWYEPTSGPYACCRPEKPCETIKTHAGRIAVAGETCSALTCRHQVFSIRGYTVLIAEQICRCIAACLVGKRSAEGYVGAEVNGFRQRHENGDTVMAVSPG